ncbi:MAG: (d)CMP kinase, partial [Candidatus Krumholzibacteria bacterium]|nr:(d)CMP kinase [Candidatus Krumholzibacteria bacterium]
MIVAIDGPAASGKSTTARGVARALGFDYLDTGSLYRSVTLAAMRADLPPEEGEELLRFLDSLDLKYRYYKGKAILRLDGENISEEIRDEKVAGMVSAYSALPSLRRFMVKLQQSYARGKNLVAEGRDMGTVVFPDAELKIFLKSDPAVRAQRRAQEFGERGRQVGVDEVQSELKCRDRIDSEREHSPLVRAEDAIELDNSLMSIEQQIEEVTRLALKKTPPLRVSPDELLYDPETMGDRNPRIPSMRWIYRVVWHTVNFLARGLFGARYHYRERAPRKGGLILACNHIAWLDPPISGPSVKRELTYVAKRELFRNRLFGAFIAYFNTVPISRGTFDRVCFDQLREALEEGGTVFFFPEGTRKPLGRLGKAKFGMGLVAHESSCPVQPVFIRGTRSWLSAIFRIRRIDVYLGRPLHIQPLRDRGLEGRELYEIFGEGVM